MKNKYLLLLLLVLVIKPLYAIDPFSLKGKTIIIPPRRVCSQYSCKAVGYGNIYNVKVLKKGKFSKNNKLDLDVYGKEIYVEDVVFFDKQDKNRAVCLVVLYEGQKIVLHYPLFVPPIKSRIYNQEDYFDYDPYSFLGDSIIGESSETITYWTHNSIHPIIDVRLKLQDPSSLNLFVYDKNTIQQKDSIYHNQTVFIEPLRNSYKYRQKPLKYVGIVYPWIVNDFDYSQLVDAYSSISNNGQWTVLLDFTDNDRHYYFDANSDIAMLEKDYMEFCKQRSHCSYVDELTSIFVGKQVHIQRNKDLKYNPRSYSKDNNGSIMTTELKNGCYLFDRIELCYTNSKDSLYYTYHGVFKQINNGVISNEDLFCPINSLKQTTIELDSVYHERIHLQEQQRQKEEQEQIQKQKQKEREYHQMLVKKYGYDNAKLIENGKVKIGFTKQMCIESWGRPNDINTTTTAYGIHEQWVYYDDYYWSFDMRCLYFDNGVLVTIQD